MPASGTLSASFLFIDTNPIISKRLAIKKIIKFIREKPAARTIKNKISPAPINVVVIFTNFLCLMENHIESIVTRNIINAQFSRKQEINKENGTENPINTSNNGNI
jgi:hypothetical protein